MSKPKRKELEMSNTQPRSETATETPKARAVDMKLEIVVIPVSDVDRAKRFLREARLEARRRLRRRRRLPRDPVHAAGLRVLGHLRQERHRGGARLRPGTVPDRLRHRGRPQRSARSRRRGQRGVPRRRRRVRRHGRALSVWAAPGQRSGSRASQLPLVRLVQRSGRQRLAVPGDHRRDCPDAWTPTTRPSPRRPNSRARSGVRRPRMASTRSGPAGTMRTGRTGTPSTWSASRPARSCRHEA